jgi:hypothetical protein
MIQLYHGSTVDIEHNLKYMKGVTFQYYFGTERAIAKLTKI